MHESADQHILERVLANNDQLAEHNRQHFDELNLFAINFMSAPGAGKTTLLETTLPRLAKDYSFGVIEGDMVGELDSERMRKVGAIVHQICTGRSCHLDAQMVARLLHQSTFRGVDGVMIENVGNLVCPAEFPLGEHKRVVLLSVAEGDDKPLKYPVIFRNCDAVVFSKCDLLPHVNFNAELAKRYVHNLNAETKTFLLSAKTGEGMSDWSDWIIHEMRSYRRSKTSELSTLP